MTALPDQPMPVVSRSEFARRYQHVLSRRDLIEVDLQTRLARVFARQGRTVAKRLTAIRKQMVTDVPLTAAGGFGAPAQPDLTLKRPRRKKLIPPVTSTIHVPTTPLPVLSASEVFMGDFDEILHDELDGPIDEHVNSIGDLLVGGLFGAAAGVFVSALTDRLGYVGDETEAAVQTVLAADARNGATFDVLGDHVSGLFDRLSGAASAAIARIEATAIVNGAATFAARVGGVEQVQRVWISQRDDRVRDAHDRADGQAVGLDEPFVVDDEELDFPGDPNGSPANVANCRCYIIFTNADNQDDQVDATADDGGDTATMADDGSGDGTGDTLTAADLFRTFAAAWDPDLHPKGADGRFEDGGGAAGRPELTLHVGRLPKEKVEGWKATLGKAAEGLDLHAPADRHEFQARVAKATASTSVAEVNKMTTLLGGTAPVTSATGNRVQGGQVPGPGGGRFVGPAAIDPNGRASRALANAYIARELAGSNLGHGFTIGGRQPGSLDERLARHAEQVRHRNETARRPPVDRGGRGRHAPADLQDFPGLHASAAELTDGQWASFACDAERLIRWLDTEDAHVGH